MLVPATDSVNTAALNDVVEAIQVPTHIPTAQPASSAQPLSIRKYNPRITDGSTWMIHKPPSNWNCRA